MGLTYNQDTERMVDRQYDDYAIEDVSEENIGDRFGLSLSLSDSMGCWIPNPDRIRVQKGDRIRLYGGFGFEIHGAALIWEDGTIAPIYYYTKAEMEARRKERIEKWHNEQKESYAGDEAEL